MSNIRQERDAALKAASDIVAQAKSAERDLTADEASQVDQHLKSVETFDAQLRKAAEDQARLGRLSALTPEAKSGAEVREDEPTTLGEHFIKHAGPRLKSRESGSRFSVEAPEFKATPVTTGSMSNVQYGGVVGLPLRRPSVADLLLSGAMGGNAYTYFVEGAVTGAPAAVAENATKPEVYGGFTQTTETLKKIAGWTKESDELVEDFPALASVVQNRLVTRLAVAEEDQILSGSGTGANVRGILNRTGIQTETATSAADEMDAVFRAMTKIQGATYLTPDFLVVNPADYQNWRLTKATGTGEYVAGGPFSGGANPPLWGLNTVVTSAIAAGTALVGAGQAAQVFRKGGVRVDVTNSNEDDFINNRITVRVEERLLLAVYVPAAFCAITLFA